MLNWLCIGIGDIAIKRAIPAIQAEPRSQLYGLLTRDPSKGKPYDCHVWTDLREALADPAIDIVYVATPVSLHAEQTILSLEAGKHVLCEKPVALNHAQASGMVDAARATGKTLGIAYYRRTYPKLKRARQLIAEGAIGRPLLAEINCAEYYNAESEEGSWRVNRALAGGGPLYDIGSHRIDVLNHLFGKPLRVSGQIANVVHDRETEDCATVLLEYGSGVRGIVDVRWNSRVSRDEFRILGTEGEINLSPLNGAPFVHPSGSEEIPNHSNVHYPLIEDFASAVLNGSPPIAPAESAIVTDWVTQQVLESATQERYLP